MPEYRQPESLGIRDVMARAASTYGQVGPDFFAVAAQGLVQEAALTSGSRVLDVGCGPGTVLAIARKQLSPNGVLIGVDLVLPMVIEARKRLGRAAEFAVMDAMSLAFADSSFDAVICAAAIYQVPDGRAAVAEMARVLRPGGLLGVSIFETANATWKGLRQLYERYLPSLPEIGGHYQAESLADLLGGCGLSRVRVVHKPLDIVYRDADEWLANAWSHGERRAFEAMEAADYQGFVEGLHASIEQERETDGRLHWRPTAIYAFGSR